MTTYRGLVIDGFGREVGTGLDINDDGELTAVLQDRLPEGSGYLVPGFIDVHNHGGGGASFPDTTDQAELRKAVLAHRNGGTTAMLASLVSLADPLPYIRALVELCESSDLAGIHLEGPFVSKAKKGAQNPDAIRPINLDELRAWLQAGRGWIRTMTVAPELENATDAAALLESYGAKASWGHTSATGDEAARTLHETARASRSLDPNRVPQTVTHLFNAMPPLAHRAPGPIREFVAAARRGEAAVEVIGDGVHIAPELVEDVLLSLQPTPENPAIPAFLVTDAMEAAGMPDGQYSLGGLSVDKRGAWATLSGTDTIAGGASRLSEQVALLAGRGRLTINQLVRATVAGPALAVGIPENIAGVTLTFRAGERPNVVQLDPDFAVRGVIREGVPLEI